MIDVLQRSTKKTCNFFPFQCPWD